MQRQGLLFVVAAPSGSGKTSLLKAALTEADSGLTVAVSHTSRAPRPGEVNGVDYYFTAAADFEAMAERGEFLEYARVYNHYYGTSIAEIERRRGAGADIVLEIDVQGAAQIKAKIPDAVLIFILPPALITLRQRLEKRNQDDEQVINLRMAHVKEEIAAAVKFDYAVINEVFATALQQLQSIFTAARLAIAKNKAILAYIKEIS